MSNTISITEARRKIFALAEEVQKPNTHIVLTQKGRPKAVIMSAEEFESWEETRETLLDIPTLPQDIRKAKRDLATGRTYTLEEVLAEDGLILMDSNSPKYSKKNVRHKTLTQGKERSKRAK